MTQPLSPPGETPLSRVDPELLRYWRTFPAPSNEVLACDLIESLQHELRQAYTMLQGSERINAELREELRQAQERCAELEKALVEYRKPPRMIVQCERHKGTPIIFKAYAQTTYASYCPQCENDAAASGPKEV